MLTGNVTYHTLMRCCESLPSSVTFDKCLLDSKISVMDIVTVISMLGDHLKVSNSCNSFIADYGISLP